MKKSYKLLILLMIFGIFTACSSSDDDSNATITISKTEYTVGAEQDSEAVATFSVNVDWTTSKISYVGDSKDWLTATPSGKAGTDQTITMKVAANPVEIERKASFDINYGGKRQKLTVTQLGENVEPKITISTSEFTVSGEQDSEAVATFSVNVDWTTSAINYVGDTKDWLTVTPEGKAGTDQTITMKVAANPVEIERKASFNINYGGKEHKLTVTQKTKGESDITAHFDAKFAAELQERGYISDATKILFSDVMNIIKVDVSGDFIDEGELTSLAGIEYFEALTELSCNTNQLTSLDLSKNKALTYLSCYFNELPTLDLSENVALTYLSCSFNQLSALDVSNNTALTDLNCQSNQLVAIDVSKNRALITFYCDMNELTTLDVSKNTALIELTCFMNIIEILDVSKNIALTELGCDLNRLTALDVSNNTALTWLYCNMNGLTVLDVSKNTLLTKLDCKGNQLTILDVSKNTALTKLDCSYNLLPTLNISKNTALTELDCKSNPGVGATFVVKSWFDNDNIPNYFIHKKGFSWIFNDKTITIDYQKVN